MPSCLVPLGDLASGDYSLSRSIAWGGCSVVRRSLYAVACMYERTPVYSCAAGIEPAHPTGRLICISVSLGRSLLVRVATLLAAFSPAAAISTPRNAPRIDECANARPNVARFRFRRYPSGRGAGRAQLSTLLIAARSCPFHRIGVCAPCGRARPATHQPSAPSGRITIGRASRMPSGVQPTRFKKAHTENEIGETCSSVRAQKKGHAPSFIR